MQVTLLIRGNEEVRYREELSNSKNRQNSNKTDLVKPLCYNLSLYAYYDCHSS